MEIQQEQQNVTEKPQVNTTPTCNPLQFWRDQKENFVRELNEYLEIGLPVIQLQRLNDDQLNLKKEEFQKLSQNPEEQVKLIKDILLCEIENQDGEVFGISQMVQHCKIYINQLFNEPRIQQEEPKYMEIVTSIAGIKDYGLQKQCKSTIQDSNVNNLKRKSLRIWEVFQIMDLMIFTNNDIKPIEIVRNQRKCFKMLINYLFKLIQTIDKASLTTSNNTQSKDSAITPAKDNQQNDDNLAQQLCTIDELFQKYKKEKEKFENIKKGKQSKSISNISKKKTNLDLVTNDPELMMKKLKIQSDKESTEMATPSRKNSSSKENQEEQMRYQQANKSKKSKKKGNNKNKSQNSQQLILTEQNGVLHPQSNEDQNQQVQQQQITEGQENHQQQFQQQQDSTQTSNQNQQQTTKQQQSQQQKPVNNKTQLYYYFKVKETKTQKSEESVTQQVQISNENICQQPPILQRIVSEQENGEIQKQADDQPKQNQASGAMQDEQQQQQQQKSQVQTQLDQQFQQQQQQTVIKKEQKKKGLFYNIGGREPLNKGFNEEQEQDFFNTINSQNYQNDYKTIVQQIKENDPRKKNKKVRKVSSPMKNDMMTYQPEQKHQIASKRSRRVTIFIFDSVLNYKNFLFERQSNIIKPNRLNIMQNKDFSLVDYDKDSEEELQELKELIYGDEDVEKEDEDEDEDSSEDEEDKNFIVSDDQFSPNSSDDEAGINQPQIKIANFKNRYINPENIGKAFIMQSNGNQPDIIKYFEQNFLIRQYFCDEQQFPLSIHKQKELQINKIQNPIESDKDLQKQFIRILHGSYENKQKIAEVFLEQQKDKYSELSKNALLKKINQISAKDKLPNEFVRRWIVSQAVFDDLDILEEYQAILDQKKQEFDKIKEEKDSKKEKEKIDKERQKKEQKEREKEEQKKQKDMLQQQQLQLDEQLLQTQKQQMHQSLNSDNQSNQIKENISQQNVQQLEDKSQKKLTFYFKKDDTIRSINNQSKDKSQQAECSIVNNNCNDTNTSAKKTEKINEIQQLNQTNLIEKQFQNKSKAKNQQDQKNESLVNKKKSDCLAKNSKNSKKIINETPIKSDNQNKNSKTTKIKQSNNSKKKSKDKLEENKEIKMEIEKKDDKLN